MIVAYSAGNLINILETDTTNTKIKKTICGVHEVFSYIGIKLTTLGAVPTR